MWSIVVILNPSCQKGPREKVLFTAVGPIDIWEARR